MSGFDGLGPFIEAVLGGDVEEGWSPFTHTFRLAEPEYDEDGRLLPVVSGPSLSFSGVSPAGSVPLPPVEGDAAWVDRVLRSAAGIPQRLAGCPGPVFTGCLAFLGEEKRR